MLEPLANVLSMIMWPFYDLTHNWWVTILLFTVVIKIILMPLSLWVQKNSIRMVEIMPDLNRIKVRYFGDSEAIGEKQNALYKEKHYHPMLSLIPLAVQVLILFGLVDVIHMITDNGAPGTEFLGMVPYEDGGASWAMPALAGLSAVALGFAQNRINPLQKEQSRAEKNTTNGLSIALSLFLGVFVAAGMAFYWICSNLTAIIVQWVCNIAINPKKYIDYPELEESRRDLEALNSLDSAKSKWWKPNPLLKREKEDYKRFFSIMNKHIVFYSEGSGFYKYFRGAIEYLLAHSDIYIHYVTNDPDDQIFKIAQDEPRIFPYYISEKRAITLFMKMDADVVVTTLGDLDNFYIKRSYVRDDIEYVYMFHHTTSMDMTSTVGEYDNYDTLLCTGPHQIEEMRQIEQFRGIKSKNLVGVGYDLIDREIADYEGRISKMGGVSGERPTVLLAPSWQEDNLLDSCVDDLIQSVLGKGYKVVVRPHPEYTKRYRARWDALQQRYSHVSEDELYFEKDFSSNDTILLADVLVTDWSSVFCEFSFATLKPSVFIDTTPKVRNPNWRDYGIDSTDISLRNRVGKSIAPGDVREQFPSVVKDMVENKERWRDQIEEIREGFFFNLGSGGDAAGEYLLETVLEHQDKNDAKAAGDGPDDGPRHDDAANKAA